jgi:Stress responsive A/B Barrel Domain
MRTRLMFGAVLGATLGGFLALSARNQIEAAAAEGSFLAHDVYFSLKENSANAKTKMVAACKKYLSKHPGEVFFAAGTRAAELNRSVNDQDFDVALHIVFKNKEAHDQYQDASRHKQFIEENQANWAKVRVFDSMVER